MRFDLIIVGLLVVTAFFTGGLLMVNDFRNTYNSTGVNFTVDEFEGTFDYMNDAFGLNDDTEQDVLEMDLEGTDQSWESMTKGSYSGVRNVAGNTFGLFKNLTYSVSNVLLIPPIFTQIAFVAFSTLALFSIIYMIFRFRP